MHYLALTRGFRSTQDIQAIQEGDSFFFCTGSVEESPEKVIEIQCNVVKGRGKKVLIDQQPLERMSDHIGRIPLVSILPADTELINGPSQGRRSFLDLFISQYDKAYLRHLIRYQRLLEQRNALLRHFQDSGRFSLDELQLWDDQLMAEGQPLLAARNQFLLDFQPVFNKYFAEIVNDRESPAITYETQLGDNSDDAWKTRFAQTLDRDRRLGYSATGIHRDDLAFHIDQKQVRHYGSQGQQKTFVVALKLAQYDLLAERSGLAPVLLLDDIFDKLDEARLASIAALLDSHIRGQVFVTDTSLERLRGIFSEKDRPVRYFQVTYGAATPV